MKEVRPVYDGYFADPFAWQHEGEYFAIGTGRSEACGHPEGRVFPLLHSKDFARWQPAGAALIRPDPAFGDTFWAPEVAYSSGTFYLYYSVGWADKSHQLRVATSASPLGPYADAGVTLSDLKKTPFAIDPHPFRDDDGRWYLFYARDFLDSDRVRPGTALAVAPLERMTKLSDDESVVLRAEYDWQRFMKDRPMYDGTYDWHTLEGPCVKKRNGVYYCLYSGGRWENDTYGVDYGVSTNVLGPYDGSGGEGGARVLQTKPGMLHGPGHNSIVFGPGGHDYIVYHAWDPKMTARRMFVSRLLWTRDGPRCANDFES